MDKIKGFKAFEAYNLAEADVAAHVAKGSIRILTAKKGGQPLTIKITDAARGVDVTVPFESIEALTDEGALFLCGSPEARLDADSYSCDLYARARARGLYLDEFGLKDETATLNKAAKALAAALGISVEEATKKVAELQAAKAANPA